MPFYNRIRLPFYLSQPQYTVDEEIYALANGTRRVLRSNIAKELNGKTDWMPAELHERMAVALRHDVVNVEGSKGINGIRTQGAYEIEWQEFLDHPVAPAKFKALVEAFVARNTRCGICPPTTYSIDAVDDVLTTALEEGETRQINVAANDSACCAGATFSIVSYDDTYIDSISIDPDTGLVTLTMKTPLESTGEVLLFTYKITCDDGTEDTAQVRGGINGSLSTPCGMPEDLLVNMSNPFDGEADISWTEPTPAPADGYAWHLQTDLGSGFVTVQSGTLGAGVTTLNLTGLLALKEYHFYIKSICGEGDESAYVLTIFYTPAASGSAFAIRVGMGEDEDQACLESQWAWLLPPDAGITTGATLYTDSTTTTPHTGWSFVRSQTGVLYNLNPVTGVVGAPTGNSC